ncbi:MULTISPECIES: aldehyde dehydrogenase family protein [unclassified Rhizobium]|uniref:aldehyde dehydrogenase family protein n=1 Tax=unclassified Rhizobium TaxID=2613769 RepID=UPI0006FED0C7|nr:MULTISPECIES: aldehyde dehydrogenase family protein [unclassified Rhizobium]KQV34970.1 aldehyde dehydrogenase [Rhizobium sp. Root1212]KRD24775.1 aldehyde dehydrogenase [Rhizobium sp. Root268]
MTNYDRDETTFIDGVWETGQGSMVLDVVDPSTGAAFAKVRTASDEQVERAAVAAARAFGPWAQLSAEERAGYLRGFARGLESRAAELETLQMINSGKPRIEASIDLGDAVATFDYYADLIEERARSAQIETSLGGGNHRGRVRHEPIGPVGLIVPWNFPLVTSAWKIAPALAAGCTAVLKPSEATPLAELFYGDIAREIGLPAGVLNIVTGAAAVGKALTGAEALRKISFTGSNAAGAKVMASAAVRGLPVSLELGGKSAIIVTEDADLDLAAECVAAGILFNAGQVCSATSRLLVHEAIEAKLLEALVERVRGMAVASPFAEQCDMGPLTTLEQLRKVDGYFAAARAEGCDCLTGGRKLDGPGYFVAPTIYRDVDVASPIWTQEIFGPVLATRRFRNDDEAIALANASDFGLAGSVVAGDPARAERLADGMDAGHIWINTPQIVYPQSAWGGFKSSGIGRELGPWGLASYQGVKHITSAA